MMEVFGKFETALRGSPDFLAFYQSDVGQELMRTIVAQLEQAEVLSLDIFDTLLLRDRKSELGRFEDVARLFVERALGCDEAAGLNPRSALVARLYAASHAYQLSEMNECTTEGNLHDIALNTVSALRLPLELSELWIECELEIESQQLELSPFIDELVSYCLEAGKTVIFVSDMYLDSSQIAALLSMSGFENLSRIRRLYSTAETVVNKRSGTIFSRVEADLETASSGFLHMGDSFNSDFKQPLKAGWMARHLPVPDAIMRDRIDDHRMRCDALFGEERFPLPMSVPRISPL